jgi:hypothetical protein
MRKAAFLFALVAAIAIGVDYGIYQHRDRQLLAAVLELDGRCGSLGGWPVGKEYRLLFEDRSFTDDEWSQLHALRESQPLPRMSVLMIALRDCELTDEQIEDAEGRFDFVEEQ